MSDDFNLEIDRRNTSSLKWDECQDVLPMWVADMDYKAPDKLIEALKKRIEHPVYGYVSLDDSFYDSYISFYKRRHNIELKRESMTYATGVIPIISSAVRAFTEIGDNIVLLTPVYHIFSHSILNNKRKMIEVELNYKDGEYSIDFEKLEQAFSLPKTKMLIFCNPHNPIGRIWSEEELFKIGQLALKYNVLVISDEIHFELTRPDFSAISYHSVSEANKFNSLTAISITKAFNCAGLQGAIALADKKEIKEKIENQLNIDECNEANIFAPIAVKTCLNECEDYLDSLRKTLFCNQDLLEDYIKREIPLLKTVHQNATYLAWIDCSNVAKSSLDFGEFLKKRGLLVSPGAQFGRGGESFIRVNVATTQSRLKKALSILKSAVEDYRKEN